MSMLGQGSDRLYWVCRCSRGTSRAARPAIHILAGEKVCIHTMTPTQLSEEDASWHSRRIESASVSTGFHTIRTGILPGPPRISAMFLDCLATWRRTSSPYRP